jgi:hypothetical protein
MVLSTYPSLVYSPCPTWHTRHMNTPLTTNPYKRHRFPAEIISYGVWLYIRFCLSYRDVEGLMLVRGVIMTSEAIRKWCRKFGQAYANQLRRRRPRPGYEWHLHDKVFPTIQSSFPAHRCNATVCSSATAVLLMAPILIPLLASQDFISSRPHGP